MQRQFVDGLPTKIWARMELENSLKGANCIVQTLEVVKAHGTFTNMSSSTILICDQRQQMENRHRSPNPAGAVSVALAESPVLVQTDVPRNVIVRSGTDMSRLYGRMSDGCTSSNPQLMLCTFWLHSNTRVRKATLWSIVESCLDTNNPTATSHRLQIRANYLYHAEVD